LGAKEIKFRLQPVTNTTVIPSTPWSTKWNEQVVIIWIRKFKRDIWALEIGLSDYDNFIIREAVVDETLSDRSRWGNMVVLDE
jgi:hypothetical protein